MIITFEVLDDKGNKTGIVGEVWQDEIGFKWEVKDTDSGLLWDQGRAYYLDDIGRDLMMAIQDAYEDYQEELEEEE